MRNLKWKIINGFFCDICGSDLIDFFKLQIEFMIKMWNASTTGSPGLGLAHLLNPKMEAHREYYDLPKSQTQTVAKPGSESRATDSDPVVFLFYHHLGFGLVWFGFQIILTHYQY